MYLKFRKFNQKLSVCLAYILSYNMDICCKVYFNLSQNRIPIIFYQLFFFFFLLIFGFKYLKVNKIASFKSNMGMSSRLLYTSGTFKVFTSVNICLAIFLQELLCPTLVELWITFKDKLPYNIACVSRCNYEGF